MHPKVLRYRMRSAAAPSSCGLVCEGDQPPRTSKKSIDPLKCAACHQYGKPALLEDAESDSRSVPFRQRPENKLRGARASPPREEALPAGALAAQARVLAGLRPVERRLHQQLQALVDDPGQHRQAVLIHDERFAVLQELVRVGALQRGGVRHVPQHAQAAHLPAQVGSGSAAQPISSDVLVWFDVASSICSTARHPDNKVPI